MDGSSTDLHWGQHCEEAVPGAAEGCRSSHVKGQADGSKKQKAHWGTMLQQAHTMSASPPGTRRYTEMIRDPTHRAKVPERAMFCRVAATMLLTGLAEWQKGADREKWLPDLI